MKRNKVYAKNIENSRIWILRELKSSDGKRMIVISRKPEERREVVL
jgi:hypothetical protein